MTSEEESSFKLIAGRLTNDGGFPAPGGSVLKSALKCKLYQAWNRCLKKIITKNYQLKFRQKLISSTVSAARSFTKTTYATRSEYYKKNTD